MMKFIVDAMLGRLARWLRILGYDTLYDSGFSDDDLFFKAHQEKRILLTRDSGLAHRMNPRYCFFISEQAVRDQLKQIIVYYQLNVEDYLFSRCTLCNSAIESIAKEDVAGRVPDFVFSSINDFFYCASCDKIYWTGSHIKQVRELLLKL
ncbi:MAG TPA: Mut7-C RNAse domain-containing protein [bacterium]